MNKQKRITVGILGGLILVFGLFGFWKWIDFNQIVDSYFWYFNSSIWAYDGTYYIRDEMLSAFNGDIEWWLIRYEIDPNLWGQYESKWDFLMTFARVDHIFNLWVYEVLIIIGIVLIILASLLGKKVDSKKVHDVNKSEMVQKPRS